MIITIAVGVVLGLLLFPVAVSLLVAVAGGFMWLLTGVADGFMWFFGLAAPPPQPLPKKQPVLTEKQRVWPSTWLEQWARDDPEGYHKGYRDPEAYLQRAHQIWLTKYRNASAALKRDKRSWLNMRREEECTAMLNYEKAKTLPAPPHSPPITNAPATAAG
jgi:hypothetical protein